MTIQLNIGGTEFRIDSECELRAEESLAPFFCPSKKVNTVNIIVEIIAHLSARETTLKVGEDLLMDYYRQNGHLHALTKGGNSGYLAEAVCDPDFSTIRCHIRRDQITSLATVGNLLRLIPLRTILQHKGCLLIHASRIDAGGRGILFTAPSGTGKTTQAKLWVASRGAKLLCNDRTLIRDGITYGFPNDGSEPVLSGETVPLGAIVCLGQSRENFIRRLSLREILTRVMPQIVMDSWDPASRMAAAQELMELAQKVPVYQLDCTPDENAVACLERQLITDGVM